MVIDYVLYASFTANFLLLALYAYTKLKPEKPRQPSKDILDILHDIQGSGTILEIKRIDPMSIFMVSPTDRGR